MTKNSIPSMSKQKKGKGRTTPDSITHVKMSEPLLANFTSRTAVLATSDSSGNGSGSYVLAPQGLTSGTNSLTSTGVVNTPLLVVDNPHLTWLWTVSQNYGRYRVLSATLRLVGQAPSTATGTLGVFTTDDPADSLTGYQLTYTTGSKSKVLDIASLSNKEFRVPMNVDSNWKSVSGVMSTGGSMFPAGTFQNQPNSVLLPLHTMKDLAFSSFQWRVGGATPSITVGQFYIDYVVEFKEPVNTVTNA